MERRLTSYESVTSIATFTDGTVWRLNDAGRWEFIRQLPQAPGAADTPTPEPEPPKPSEPPPFGLVIVVGPTPRDVEFDRRVVEFSVQVSSKPQGEVYLFGWPNAPGHPNVFYRPGSHGIFVGATGQGGWEWVEQHGTNGVETIGAFKCVRIGSARDMHAIECPQRHHRVARVFELPKKGSYAAEGFEIEFPEARLVST